jgi:hypothetical protein
VSSHETGELEKFWIRRNGGFGFKHPRYESEGCPGLVINHYYILIYRWQSFVESPIELKTLTDPNILYFIWNEWSVGVLELGL